MKEEAIFNADGARGRAGIYYYHQSNQDDCQYLVVLPKSAYNYLNGEAYMNGENSISEEDNWFNDRLLTIRYGAGNMGSWTRWLEEELYGNDPTSDEDWDEVKGLGRFNPYNEVRAENIFNDIWIQSVSSWSFLEQRVREYVRTMNIVGLTDKDIEYIVRKVQQRGKEISS
jgi:hypothetical protein